MADKDQDKKPAETTKTQAAQNSDKRVIYVGPNLRTTRMTTGSVYLAGVPAHIAKSGDKNMIALFVPIKDMRKAQAEIEMPGSKLNTAKKAVLEADAAALKKSKGAK